MLHAYIFAAAARAQVLSHHGGLWAGHTVEECLALDQEGRVVITDHGVMAVAWLCDLCDLCAEHGLCDP